MCVHSAYQLLTTRLQGFFVFFIEMDSVTQFCKHICDLQCKKKNEKDYICMFPI